MVCLCRKNYIGSTLHGQNTGVRVIHSAQDPVKQVLDTVASTIREYNMIEPGHTVICAVSGGPDSMCLLDSLYLLGRPGL